MPGAESTARTCAAGTANAYISPDGIVFPCLNWRDPIGDLRQTDFKILWAESPVVKKQREITRASYLDDCSGAVSILNATIAPGSHMLNMVLLMNEARTYVSGLLDDVSFRKESLYLRRTAIVCLNLAHRPQQNFLQKRRLQIDNGHHVPSV